MKKLFVTLAALSTLSMGAWAESSQREGAMNIEGILLWKMPAGGGTMTIYGDEYQPMRNYTSADDNLRHFAGPEVESIDMKRGFNIGSFAFCELENLESVTLHGSSFEQLPIYCIGDSAFAGSSKLASINSKDLDDLRYIGANAFAGTAIKTFTINKPMGRELVYYAMQANGFSIDLNLEHCYIGTSAFADCPYLSTVYMKDDTPFADTYNNFLNDYAYLVVNSAEAAATYRAAWTEIADRIICLQENITFENKAVKDICISNWDTNGDGELSYEEAFAVTDFGDAFAGNTTITKIDGLEPFVNVTVIGSEAFAGCTALESITIPPHITDIADDAFTGCTNLKEIHFVNKTPQMEDFTIQTNERTYIIVPDDAVGAYDSQWADKKDLIFGEGHIRFQCPVTEQICVANWDANKDGGLSYEEAAKVTSIGTKFKSTAITSFDEFKYFTGIKKMEEEFYHCSSLTSVSIPESVTLIESYYGPFMGCTSLHTLIIEDGNSQLTVKCSTVMFRNTPLKHVYLGRYVFSNYKDFAGLLSLSSLTIGEGVTSLSSSASFEGCSNLTSVTILGSSLSSIYSRTFYGCSSIDSVAITDIAAWCKINFGDEYTNPLRSAGAKLFLNGEMITDLVIPNSVTSISKYAFYGYKRITSVDIPSSVTSIGASAFSDCSGLITFESETPIAYNSYSGSAVYVVPDNAVESYKTAWADVAYRITGKSALGWKEVTCEAQPTTSHLAELIGVGNELNVTKLRIKGTINSYDMMVMRSKMQNLRELDLTDATIVANSYNYGTGGVSMDNNFPDFMSGKHLYNLLLPTSITRIGNNALNGCRYIKSITIPDNVTSIGSYAFQGCNLLSTVNVTNESKLATIDNSAFFNTSNLQSIDLSPAAQLTSLGTYAFRSSAIKTIALPASLKAIGDYAFQSCTSLVSYASGASIGQYAFEGCTALQTVTIAEGVTSIGKYAFTGCTALQSISLPESLTSLDTYAFNGCTALKAITLPDALTSLGTYAFNGCTALEKAEIGMGITSVPQYLFRDCTALKEVKLSPKTTTIQSYAFYICKGLTELHLPPYLTTIESNAFGGCSNLKEIYAYMPDVPAIAASTFSNYSTSTLYAPGFLFDAYYYDEGWNKFLQVQKCDLRPGDYEAFYTNKDLYFKEGEERITEDRPIVELGNQGAIIVEGADQEFTTVDMLRGTTSSSLIGDGNITMDELRVKINVSKQRWYFLCFPYDVEITECTYPGKYAWRYYDGATRAANGTGGWQKIEGTTLKAGVGYIFQSDTAGDLIVKFSDPEFGGDRPTTLNLYSSTNAANASWNFVGNPYASYYDFGSEELASPITVWNGTTYVACRPGDDDYHLQPYEAFFVQKTEDASAINFDTEGRETYSQSVATATAQARARRQRGITPERLIVNLTISDNDTAFIDRTRYVMNAKASRSYELACDASKFISDDAAAQLYTMEGTVKMAINERPGEGEVRLGYIASKAGTLRLEAQRMDLPMEIIDTKTDRIVDLSKGAYEFTTEAGTFDNRFVMRTSREATEIIGLAAATGVAIGMQEGGLTIGGADDKCISIYAANGALVAEHYGNGYVALASGTYVVKVDGHSAKMYVK